MKILLEVDPETGAQHWADYHYATNEFTFWTEEDVAPHVEYSKALAKDEEYSRNGIRNDMWHYAHIPNTIIDDFFRKGINPFLRENHKKVFQLINSEYPALKTTAGWHMHRPLKKSAS